MSMHDRIRIACSLVVLAFASLVSPAARAAAPQHGGHDSAERATPKETRVGDPYLLEVDPVSGKKLGPVEKQVVRIVRGREFRFAGKETADQFAADPAKYVAAVDAKVVEQQKALYPLDTCVVSGEKLDAKAGAVDFVWANRLVRVSSKEHQEQFLADPAKYVAKLDAAVIEKQKAAYALSTCPVTGGELGGMGEPVDHVAGNRLVRFCCKGCLKDFEKDPLKHFGKLDEARKTKGGAKDAPGKSASYVCPMHADVVQAKPGRCPKCGMDLVKKK